MKSPKETTASATTKSQDKPLIARRAIIKGAAGALPTILTLQSGAALARSSNLIRPVTDAATAKDANNRTLCLSQRSVDNVYQNGQIDLGPSGYGHVTAITERDYYREPHRRAASVTEQEMCEEGQTVYFRRMGWRSKQAPQGWLVSANNLGSFANISIDEI